MTVYAKNLISAKTVETSQTTQYEAMNVTTIIDKFTATNYSSAAASISVYVVNPGNSVGNANLIIKDKTLQPSEVYTFPELVGQILNSGDYIVTSAGTVDSINMRMSGREITN